MTPVLSLNYLKRLETSARALKSVSRLLGCPGQYAHRVVAITENVITRRKTMLGAIYLHLVELLHVKLMSSYHAPVMRRGIHREAWSQRTVSTNNQ